MEAQFCEYADTKIHWNVYFKYISFMICKLCLNKAVKKVELAQWDQDLVLPNRKTRTTGQKKVCHSWNSGK